MPFWNRSQAEREAKAALSAARENARIARAQVKTAKAVLKTTKATGQRQRIELRTRAAALKHQRAEERQEARYFGELGRLQRDELRGRAKPVRVRGSRRSRRYRRSLPRR